MRVHKKSPGLLTGLVKKKPGITPGLFVYKVGGDLLSRLRSTIGADGLNFSVRNGKRWNPVAITTLRSFRKGPLCLL